jgi:hypothetical protein
MTGFMVEEGHSVGTSWPFGVVVICPQGGGPGAQRRPSWRELSERGPKLTVGTPDSFSLGRSAPRPAAGDHEPRHHEDKRA